MYILQDVLFYVYIGMLFRARCAISDHFKAADVISIIPANRALGLIILHSQQKY